MKLYKTPDSAIAARHDAKLNRAEAERLQGAAEARVDVAAGMIARRDELEADSRGVGRDVNKLQVRKAFATVTEKLGALASGAAARAAKFFAGVADRTADAPQVTTLDVERDPTAIKTSQRLANEIGAKKTEQRELTARAQKMWAGAVAAMAGRDDLLAQSAAHAEEAAKLTRQARRDTIGATYQMYLDHAAAGLAVLADKGQAMIDGVRDRYQQLKAGMFSGFKQAAFKAANHFAKAELDARGGDTNKLSKLPAPNEALAWSMANLPVAIPARAPAIGTPEEPLRGFVLEQQAWRAEGRAVPSALELFAGQGRLALPAPEQRFALPAAEQRLALPAAAQRLSLPAAATPPLLTGPKANAPAATTTPATPSPAAAGAAAEAQVASAHAIVDLRTLYTLALPSKPVHWAAFAAGLDYSAFGEGLGKTRQRELEDLLVETKRAGVEVLPYKGRTAKEVKHDLTKRYGLKETADFGQIRDEWFKRQLVGLPGLAPREKLDAALAARGLDTSATITELLEAPSLRQRRSEVVA
jgi:hypothetical protein